MTYIICADGACSGNPGPGGFAFEIWQGSVAEGNEITGGAGSSAATTNNIMELKAAIGAFEALRDLVVCGDVPAGSEVKLRFDSQYVLKGIFEWMTDWKARGWRTGAGKPVKNRELWEELDTLLQDLDFRQMSLKPDWVKGHAGDIGNERVDAKAAEMRDLARIDLDQAAAHATTTESPDALAHTPGAVDLMAMTRLPNAPMPDPLDLVGLPRLPETPETAKAEATNSEQVRLMRTILGLYESGDYSVKKVIEEIRANAIALGCK